MAALGGGGTHIPGFHLPAQATARTDMTHRVVGERRHELVDVLVLLVVTQEPLPADRDDFRDGVVAPAGAAKVATLSLR